MKSSTLNYITIITNIHIAQSMHINVSIPETNTHVKENRKTEEEKTFLVDTMIMLDAVISLCNEESFGSSNKHLHKVVPYTSGKI